MTEDYLRVGDAEREQAIAELRRAAEDGRLAPNELDERTELARRAVTRGELLAVQPGLPAPAAWGGAELLPGGPAGLALAGYSSSDPLVLAGRTGSRRSGAWLLPPFLRTQASLENVRIDCLQARAAAEVIDLEVLPGMGRVLLIVPGGWAVNVDRLSEGIGSIRVRVPGIPAPGCPIVVVRGSTGIGRFKARDGGRRERRRLARG